MPPARARADSGVRAVILTSAFERSFSAGMDLAMIRGKRGLDLRHYLQKLYFEMHDLQLFPPPPPPTAWASRPSPP